MNLQILPLAITMMAGPQIMSAIVLVTGERPVKASAAFVAAVAAAAATSVGLAMLLFTAAGTSVDLSSESEPTTGATAGQLVLVGLLILLSIKTWVGRDKVTLPKWMGTLQQAAPGRAAKIGFMLILVMPTDVITCLTVGLNLVSNDLPYVAALPFLALTVLIAALPLLTFAIFRRRAEVFMPKVRTWMTGNAWAVNVFVYALFIFLILS